MKKDNSTMDAISCANGCSCSTGAAVPVGLGRREFVTYAGAALAALALAACSAGDGMTSPSTIGSASLKVSDFPTLASVGGVATTVVSGVPIAIVRTASSSFSVFSRICPHQGSTINSTSTGFYCPNHGATFNSAGQWVGGQRTGNLTSYPVTYDASTGMLAVGS